MNQISELEVRGYKSIRHQCIQMGPLNVLIGANGSGKSNLVSFFKMLNFAMTDSLSLFVARSGGGDGLLYYGAKNTPQLVGRFVFETTSGTNTYCMRLVHGGGDCMIFADESIDFRSHADKNAHEPQSLGAGHKETALPEAAAQASMTADVIKKMMDRWKFFQFHDTSDEAKIRQSGYIKDTRYLRADGGNLAAFLHKLKLTKPEHYMRIVATIRMAAPFFGDFVLAPDELNSQIIRLNWQERGADMLFGPHQLSDGTLRFMALATLLLQPRETLPGVLVIDEPELGLHPYAITLLGSLLHAASENVQIVVSTQSTELLDQFDPEDIIVVERTQEEGSATRYESVFRRLDSEQLKEWLQDYSLSELWNKNVLGGRPSR